MESTLTFQEYLEQNDWRVKENSNSIYSFGGLCRYVIGKATAEYWAHLYDARNPDIMRAHKQADIHVHDLGSFSSYCFGASLKDVLMDGIRGIKNMATSRPPTRLRSVCSQIASLVTILQNEIAGAIAFSSVNTYLAPFVYFDALRRRNAPIDTTVKQTIVYTEEELAEVRLSIESLIYQLNENSRLGAEACFSNMTFDLAIPKTLQDTPVIYRGNTIDLTYSAFQEEAELLLQIFIEVLQQGDGNGAPFTYPIPTFNIGKNMDWDSPKFQSLWAFAAKTGAPYFGNYITSPMTEDDVYSMCCRLRLDKTELLRKAGGLFGAAERTGSIGVVTINLPACGYQAKTKDELFARVRALADLCGESLRIKREVLQHYFDAGLYPALKQYLKRLDTLFSTIGFVGAHEMCLNFLGKGIETEEGRALTIEVIEVLLESCKEWQTRTGDLYNLEYTPAESTAYRFAKHDQQRFPTIITSGIDTPYYTNSTHLPVDIDWTYTEILRHQHGLLSKATGGSAWHCYLKEAVKPEIAKQFVRKTFERFDIPYMSLSPLYSVCANCGYIEGGHEICPKCGEATEQYQRITGYVRPVSNFNAGKAEEFKRRKQHTL